MMLRPLRRLTVAGVLLMQFAAAAPSFSQIDGNPGDDSASDDSRKSPPDRKMPAARVALLEEAAAWGSLAAGRRLPHWARALAGSLPRTTAAMLRLDYLY